MRCAYIGNFRHDFCTEVHIARELRGLGHAVEEFQEPSNPSYRARFLRDLEHWCRSHEPDLVMFTRTWGLPPHTTELWRRLEARGTKTCSYHLDLYVGLKREAGIDSDPFWTTQYVFTPDGDPRSAEFFASKGINHHWSPPAVVSDECVPGMWRDEYNYDVVFVGSEGYHDEWKWRPTLIDYLTERYGSRFRRFGGDKPEGPTRGKDLNDLYASCRVVVGDSLALPGHTNYWSDRYYETVGRGGFLVAPLVPGIERDFVDGEHLAFYDHPGEDLSVTDALEMLGDLIDYCLDMPGEDLRVIANAGQRHVRENHTYRNRLSAALAVMGFGRVSVDTPDLLIIDDPVKKWDEPAHGAMMEKWLKGRHPSWPPEDQVGYTRITEGDRISAMLAPIEKLELGSGFHPTPGFTHLDLNPACHPDILGPAWPLELPDESVGEIRAVDVLEHESWQNTAAILADWFRVLRPGGKLFVQVPEAALVIRWYCEGREDLLVDRLPVNAPVNAWSGVVWRLMGGHFDGIYATVGTDWRFNAHAALFSEGSLAEALWTAGFVLDDMRVNGHPNAQATCHKP